MSNAHRFVNFATPPVTYYHKRSEEVDTVSDAAGLLTLARSNGRVLGEAYSGSGILSGKSLTRGVDAFNRVNSLGATSVTGLSMTFDDASRLATVTQGSRVTTYTHGDALQTIEQIRIETSGTERYRLSRTHDKLGRVTRIDTLGNETTLHARRDYRHNNANQRTEVTKDSTLTPLAATAAQKQIPISKIPTSARCRTISLCLQQSCSRAILHLSAQNLSFSLSTIRTLAINPHPSFKISNSSFGCPLSLQPSPR